MTYFLPSMYQFVFEQNKKWYLFPQVSVFNTIKIIITHFRLISIISANCVQKHNSNLSRSTCKFWEQLPKNQEWENIREIKNLKVSVLFCYLSLFFSFFDSPCAYCWHFLNNFWHFVIIAVKLKMIIYCANTTNPKCNAVNVYSIKYIQVYIFSSGHFVLILAIIK